MLCVYMLRGNTLQIDGLDLWASDKSEFTYVRLGMLVQTIALCVYLCVVWNDVVP